jgi:hypothetical protein
VDIDDLRTGRLNNNRRAWVGYGLPRRALKIARPLRPLAHFLHRIGHILLLVVVAAGVLLICVAIYWLF